MDIQKKNKLSNKSTKDFIIFHFKYTIIKSIITIFEEKNKPLIKLATDNFSTDISILF